ncbi:MAG: thioredoxin family protein [Planctomycetota bacterium]|nr:thioredoxin family protein [Planctomycetota bacterium]
MLDPANLRNAFSQAFPYSQYVATGSAPQQDAWCRGFDRIALTPNQSTLIAGFERTMNVLVLSGMWCGDCSAQVPMLERIAQANPAAIRLRIGDRDVMSNVAERVRICGGLRVPTAIWLNEDFEFVSILGDRTLSRYRAMAAANLGGACPLPGAPIPADEAAATLADWVGEFERVHLILRLSPKLRQRHGD